jgi:hypothetical protein
VKIICRYLFPSIEGENYMRKLLIISLLCLFVGINFLNAKEHSSKERHKDKHCHKDCHCRHVISSKRLNKGQGVVIDKPGVWCLDGDVVFKPKASRFSPPDARAVQAAITVKAGVLFTLQL